MSGAPHRQTEAFVNVHGVKPDQDISAGTSGSPLPLQLRILKATGHALRWCIQSDPQFHRADPRNILDGRVVRARAVAAAPIDQMNDIIALSTSKYHLDRPRCSNTYLWRMNQSA